MFYGKRDQNQLLVRHQIHKKHLERHHCLMGKLTGWSSLPVKNFLIFLAVTTWSGVIAGSLTHGWPAERIRQNTNSWNMLSIRRRKTSCITIFVKSLYSGTGYITKPSYNKVILLVPVLYFSLFFPLILWETCYNKVVNCHGPKVLVVTGFHCTRTRKHSFGFARHIYCHTNTIQSTLPKSNSHKSNNCLSRRSIQILFSLYSIVFNPS